MKLQDVFSVLTADEVMIAAKADIMTCEFQDDADNFVVVYDKQLLDDHHIYQMKRVYRVFPDGDLKEVPINAMIKEIIPKIEKSLNVREFLEEVLKSSGPHTVERLYEIVTQHPEAVKKAKTRPGCYILEFENPEPGKDKVSLFIRE